MVPGIHIHRYVHKMVLIGLNVPVVTGPEFPFKIQVVARFQFRLGLAFPALKQYCEEWRKGDCGAD